MGERPPAAIGPVLGSELEEGGRVMASLFEFRDLTEEADRLMGIGIKRMDERWTPPPIFRIRS